MIQFEAAYTEDMLVRASRTFMVRRMRWGRWAAAYALLALGLGPLLWSGDQSWVVGAGAAVALLPLAFLAAARRAHRIQARDSLRRMGEPVASVAMTDDALHVTSGQGRAELPWRTLTGIAVEPGYWMVLAGQERFIVLPSAAMPPGALEFARSRIAAASGAKAEKPA